MERAGVLIDKLQEQFSRKADVQLMLVTAQLLHNELLLQANQVNGNNDKKISVEVPNAAVITQHIVELETSYESYKPVAKPEPEPDPVAEPMPEPELPLPEPVPTPTPKPEPEPIPHFVEQKPWLSVFPTEVKAGSWALDPVLDIPTLAHQEKTVYELNDTMVAEGAASLNDKLKQNKAEMSSLLQEAPIRDLKKAISINDRHRFIRELFRDDETMYERSIKTINSFYIFAEAEYWIQRELKLKLGWDFNNETVKSFDQLVKRRFS
jgi:type IV secretory pathway VirB10-like protein